MAVPEGVAEPVIVPVSEGDTLGVADWLGVDEDDAVADWVAEPLADGVAA